MVSFDKVGDKAQAWRTVAEWGNQVIKGRPFSEVAEKESHGATSYNKGQYDWTSKSALKSAVLDQAIFSLPVGQLSQILEDESGYHIIRVTGRKDAGRVEFEQAQAEIRKKLIDEEQKEARRCVPEQGASESVCGRSLTVIELKKISQSSRAIRRENKNRVVSRSPLPLFATRLYSLTILSVE